MLIYERAVKLNADSLRISAADFISSNWLSLSQEHFKDVNPRILLDLFMK